MDKWTMDNYVSFYLFTLYRMTRLSLIQINTFKSVILQVNNSRCTSIAENTSNNKVSNVFVIICDMLLNTVKIATKQ